MEITLFAKRCTSRDGRAFVAYKTSLPNRKTGSAITATVKFRRDCPPPSPERCPCNIVVDTSDRSHMDANLARGEYTRPDTGEIISTYTRWVNRYTDGSKYEDHSVDDYI